MMNSVSERIEAIESQSLSKGAADGSAIQAFILAKVARILTGTTERRIVEDYDADGDAFYDIRRLCTNGGGGDRLLEDLRELNELFSDDDITALGDELVAGLVADVLVCDEPAALAMSAVAREFRSQLEDGFPSVEPVLDKAEALLAQ